LFWAGEKKKDVEGQNSQNDHVVVEVEQAFIYAGLQSGK
jgi:hypothetical protein